MCWSDIHQNTVKKKAQLSFSREVWTFKFNTSIKYDIKLYLLFWNTKIKEMYL